MTELHVPATAPLTDEGALEQLRSQPGGHVEIAVSALARQWGWGRSKLRRRLESWEQAGLVKRAVGPRGKSIITLFDAPPTTPTDSSPMLATEVIVQSASEPKSAAPVAGQTAAGDPRQLRAVAAHGGPKFLAGAVLVVGGLAALVGLGLNASFLWQFGRTPEAGVLFASIGMVIDGATLILPSAVAGLFSRRCYVLVVFAALLCVLAWTMTIFVSIGFATANIGDTVVGRGGALSQRASIVEAIERLTVERNRLPSFVPTGREGVAAGRAAVALAIIARDQACRRPDKNCRRREAELAARQLELMQAQKDKAATDQAALLDARLGDAQVALNALPVVGGADPQIEGAIRFVGWISGGRIVPNATDMNMLRIVGLAALPVLAGLFSPLGMALREPLRRKHTGNRTPVGYPASSDG